MYAPSQWVATLHCNVASHWLSAFIKRSLVSLQPLPTPILIGCCSWLACYKEPRPLSLQLRVRFNGLMSIRYRFFKGLDVVYYKDKSLYVNPYFNATYQILHDHEHIPWVRFLYMVEQVLSQWKKKRCRCNVFHHWLRPWSAVNRKWALIWLIDNCISITLAMGFWTHRII